MSHTDMIVEPTNYAACTVKFVNVYVPHKAVTFNRKRIVEDTVLTKASIKYSCNSDSCVKYFDGTSSRRAIKPVSPVAFMTLPPAAITAKIAAFITQMQQDTRNSRRYRLGIADTED